MGIKKFVKCPHHIIKDTIKIIEDQIEQKRNDEEPPALRQTKDNQKILQDQHEELMIAINAIKEELKEIKAMV